MYLKNITRLVFLACRIVVNSVIFAVIFLAAVIWHFVKQAVDWIVLSYKRWGRPSGVILSPSHIESGRVYFKNDMLDEDSACQILSKMGPPLIPNRPKHIIYLPEVPGYLLCYQGVLGNMAGLLTPAEMPDFWYYFAGGVDVGADKDGSKGVYTEYGVYWFEKPGELAVLTHVFPSIQGHLDKVGFRLLNQGERRERLYSLMPPEVKKATDNLRASLYANFNSAVAKEDGVEVSHDI